MEKYGELNKEKKNRSSGIETKMREREAEREREREMGG